ncbi:MAG: pilin [Candidatus Nealsonbacteria bacterium]
MSGNLITKTLLISLLAFSFLFILSGGILAVGVVPPPPDDEDECDPSMSTWTETEYDADEFKCESEACGTDILNRERWREYECWDDGCGDSGCDFVGYTYTDPTTFQTMNSWQRCEPYQADWEENVPDYGCQGNCLQIPENDKYYDNPEYSDQPDKNIGNTKIKLPVKLDWSDVEGWGQEDGPQSYVVTVTTSTDKFSSEPLLKSEYVPRVCLLPSNKTTDWEAKACCTIDGNNCGLESDWDLTANSSPELVSPQDPDWTGDKSAENVPLPITLDWCSVEEAKSYQFLVYIIEDGEKKCHPLLASFTTGKEVCEPRALKKERREGDIEKIVYSDFRDEFEGLFTKDTLYEWQISVCSDDIGINCEEFSHSWTFSPTGEVLPISYLAFPANDSTVGLPVVLDWNNQIGVNSYIYEITQVSNGQTITDKTKVSQAKPLNYPDLSLNTLYRWKVKPCIDYESERCEDFFGEEWTFRTTGRAPSLNSPLSNEQNVVIPVSLSWENVPGSKSYILKVSGSGLNVQETLNKPEFSLDFPEYPISQETNYSWQIRTCAWQDGKTCGQYGETQEFRTFRLPAPQNPIPGNNGQLSTDENYVSWEKIPGAKAYQYKMSYVAKDDNEIDETCSSLIGQDLFSGPKLVLNNSDYLNLRCLGQYSWQIRSCLDKDCHETSNWSNNQTLTLLETSEAQGVGLVPCGKTVNDTKTPWNERDPCQVKHIFLLVKIVIDFLLFRLAPIALVLLTVATAVMFYFSVSTGGPSPIIRAKSLWKSTGIGLALMFLAWTIVNIFLNLVGFQVGVFGNWYQF